MRRVAANFIVKWEEEVRREKRRVEYLCVGSRLLPPIL